MSGVYSSHYQKAFCTFTNNFELTAVEVSAIIVILGRWKHSLSAIIDTFKHKENEEKAAPFPLQV